MEPLPSYLEECISQIPALQLLMNLGYTYLPPSEALRLRGGRLSNVVLEDILADWLRKNNVVRVRGREYPFQEGNILEAVQAVKNIYFDGVVRTNEKLFELISMGKSLQQSIDGDIKGRPLIYVDWQDWSRNVFHCTAEFSVEREGRLDTYRPDIVLFVNGMPFCVIECKSPRIKHPIDQAIKQHVDYQTQDGIPRLYAHAQLLLGVATDDASYATAGTPKKFWGKWKEKGADKQTKEIAKLINKHLSNEKKALLFSDPFTEVRNYFEAQGVPGNREVTEQDRAIYNLCRPERLVELSYFFTLFDGGEKKIARYQQYFCAKATLERVKQKDKNGVRRGGVVWHTQGSGKSLTMVMLAKLLMKEPTIPDGRIVLVTDRVDLDSQIYGTFKNCGKAPVQAKTGAHLMDLLEDGGEDVIATVIDKFESGAERKNTLIDDPNLFVLVDEGHRTQYGTTHAQMRKVLPNACFLAFTGTPIAKKYKNTIQKFGDLIHTYTIKEAERDEAIVPLLYEGRHVPQDVDEKQIDDWFDKLTIGLSDEQRADLKRKFASTDQLNKAEQRVARIAWDVSVHFKNNWQNSGYKAQLVTPDKATALMYRKYIREFGMVSCEVLISGPGTREGDDIYAVSRGPVRDFWEEMMDKYGDEDQYNKLLIGAFKNSDEPEIIIVVDKLLVGFDEPRNTVLYLARRLKDHNLLQAIARVNRLKEGKEFGYIIDYRGVLADLSEAINIYSDLDSFESIDLEGIVTDISVEIASLPQRQSELLDIFKGIRNRNDIAQYERLLGDIEIREKFYDKFSAFARTLGIAMSSAEFLSTTPESEINAYKDSLKFFKNLRYTIRRRYAETVEFSDYESKIRKLINTHVGAGEAEIITPLVNIHDEEAFAKEVDKLSDPASKADTIAHRVGMTISQKMSEDPAFYSRFSKLLNDAIRAFRNERLSANEYLARVVEIMTSVRTRSGDDIPPELQDNDDAKALFGSIKGLLNGDGSPKNKLTVFSRDASLGIAGILDRRRIVSWTTNPDVRNLMKNEMEDYLCHLRDELEFEISFEDIDRVMDESLKIYGVRNP